MQAEHLLVEDNFLPDVGFLRRRNFRRSYGEGRYSPRPQSLEQVRQFRLEGSFDYTVNANTGQLETGPISLCWATRHPVCVSGLFILNTFAHRPRGPVKLPAPLKLFRTPGVGELMVKGLHMFVKVFLFRAGVTKPDRFTSNVKAAYLAPHPSWSTRTSILVFPREIPSGPEGPVSDMNADIDEKLKEHFRAKPVRIMWAMQDIAFTPEMLDELWLDTFPDAEVTRIPDAGHYLQEDAYEVIVPALLDFVVR